MKIPETAAGRRREKAELQELIRLNQGALRQLQKQRAMIEESEAIIQARIIELSNHAQLIAEAMLEDEYKALTENNL